MLLALIFMSLMFHGVRVCQAECIAGGYRCWSYNVGGADKRCMSPPIVLNADGTYKMSSEYGTYKVTGDQIILSESKMRGPGHVDGEGHIVFQYTYKGWQHTVTYMRQGGAGPAAQTASSKVGHGLVSVDVTIHYPPSDGSVGWINTASLVPPGGSIHKMRYDALARTDGKQTVEVSFREVPAGQVYTLYIGSGLENRQVGHVDLRKAKGAVELSIDVPAAAKAKDRFERPATESQSPVSARPEQESAPKNLPKCDPRLPHYSQPPCQDE